jgi:hypothetical protein
MLRTLNSIHILHILSAEALAATNSRTEKLSLSKTSFLHFELFLKNSKEHELALAAASYTIILELIGSLKHQL